jgi:Aminoglycoside-2''-adenylyltransferase
MDFIVNSERVRNKASHRLTPWNSCRILDFTDYMSLPKPFHVVLEVAEMLYSLDKPWYIAGGWAIDLYLGQQRRNHKDVDIAVFRQDQLAFQGYFLERGWKLWKYIGDSVQVEPWSIGEQLMLPDRGILAEPSDVTMPQIDILLSEIKGDSWYYHADSRITHPLKTLGLRSDLGVPFFSPEIVLLFKARQVSTEEPNDSVYQEKDEKDFQAIRRLLTAEQRAWLAEALTLFYSTHPWLKDLMPN